MAAFNAGDIQATASLDRTPFTRELEAATRLGNSFDGTVYTAKLDADISSFYDAVDEADSRLDEFKGKDANATLDADSAPLTEKVAEADAELDRVGEKHVDATADADIRPLEEKMAEAVAESDAAGKKISDNLSGGGGGGFNPGRYTALGSAIALGVAGAAPALTGLAGGLGVLGGAFVGISGAVKAYDADQKASTAAAGTAATSAVSNAKAITSAENSIADARKAQARAAQDSAVTIFDAQRSLNDANDAYVLSEQKVADAAKAAAQSLQDQQDKVAGFALTQEGASISLARAIENQQKVDANGQSTALDKREATYQVLEAQQKLTDVNKQGAKDQADLNTLQAEGIQGSPQVVAAKQAEKSAAEGVQKAQEALGIAQRNAARSQSDAAEAVGKAVQNLADVQAQQGAAADKAAAKNNTYAAALAKLSPAGAAFAQQLISMKSGFQQFEQDTQAAVLPGFTNLLKGIQEAQPGIEGGFVSLGKTIGDVGTQAGDLFKNPVFQGQLTQALEQANPVITATGDGLVHAFDSLVKFSATAGPITQGLSSLIQQSLGGLDGFFSGLQAHASGVGSLFDVIGTVVQKVEGFIGTLIGQIGDAFSQLKSRIGPTLDELTATVEKFTQGGLSGFAGAFGTVLDVVKLALEVIQPFAGLIGTLVGQFGALALGVKIFGSVFNPVISGFKTVAGLGGTLADKLYAIAPASAKAGTGLEDANGKVKKLSEGATTSATSLGKFLDGASKVAKNLPLFGVAVGAVVDLYNNFIPSADDVATKLEQGGQAAADATGGWNGYGSAVSQAGGAADLLGAQMSDVDQKLKDHYDSLTPVQRNTEYVTQAQNDLTYAIKVYGDGSPQAVLATAKMAEGTKDLKDAQYDAAQKVKGLNDRIQDQQDLELGSAGAQISFERATNNIATAQQAVNDALAKNGPASAEVKQAQLDLQQAFLDAVTAAGSLSDAQTANLSPSEQQRAHIHAINDELITLAVQYGTNLPPALQQMVNKLSDSDIAASGAKDSVDKLGNRVLTLPTGKTLTFPTNADAAKGAIDGLATAVDHAAGSYYNFMQKYVAYVDLVNAPQDNNINSLAGLLGVSHRAGGGPVVGGKPYLVGEKGPELIFPTQAGYVATANQTAAMAKNATSQTQYASASADQSEVIAAGLAQLVAMFNDGLRVSFDSQSLQTGLIVANKDRGRR